MDGTKSLRRLAALGISFGILEILLLIVPIVIGLLTLGLGWGVVMPLCFLFPVGLVGSIVSWVAFKRLKESDLAGTRSAKLGIVFNLVGSVIGILWLILLFLLVSSVFGQWY